MAKDEERPQVIDVELTTGDVIKVGVLNWNGYKKLKPKIVERLAFRAGEVFSEPAALEGGAASMAPLMAALDEILGDLTPEFVKACVADASTLKGVSRPVDWLRLREAAAVVNDLTEILELEGNALMASVTTVMKRVVELSGTDDGGSA